MDSLYDKLTTEQKESLDWTNLSRNPAAIRLLETNLDKVDWYQVSFNPEAIHILEANLDKVDWWFLFQNPAAIHLLEEKLDKIKVNWILLSLNPGLFYEPDCLW